ncbi:MAG: hypothetical protein ACRDNM_10650 [Gaiellaceae bacterium]
MRRLAILCLPLIALVAPATALALGDGSSSNDGTLVVKSASAPRTVPVVTLVINGTALGHVSTGSPDQTDTVVIDDPNNTNDIGASITSGGNPLTRKTVSTTETKFVGSDFRFRAAGGTYKIWIYGSGVDVFAVGKGTVIVQGQSDSSTDGWYAIDGGARHSLPAVPSSLLTFPLGG